MMKLNDYLLKIIKRQVDGQTGKEQPRKQFTHQMEEKLGAVSYQEIKSVAMNTKL